MLVGYSVTQCLLPKWIDLVAAEADLSRLRDLAENHMVCTGILMLVSLCFILKGFHSIYRYVPNNIFLSFFLCFNVS